ncbi:MAG: LptF/LptG family permease [Verrucomicrobiota bacterium]|nr:LptF/LptG family permease [Verrucomicrobiota bacterium]
MAKRKDISHIISSYIFKDFFFTFCCCLFGFIILFLIVDLFDILQDFVDHKASFRDAGMYFVLLQPFRIVVIVPMTLLLSIMYSFSNFSRHNEITAIRAAGISIYKNCRYLWIFTGIIIVFLIWFSEYVVPGSYRKAQVLEEQLTEKNYVKKPASCLAFRNNAEMRDWYFEFFTPQSQKKIVIKQFRPDGTIDWELRAKTSRYTEDRKWIFMETSIYQYDKSGMLLAKPPKRLKKYVKNDFSENPNEIYNSLRPLYELSSRELYKLLKNQPNLAISTKQRIKTTIYYRILFPFSCLIMVLMAIPFSMSSKRQGIAVNLGLAIAFMLIYYTLLQFFTLLGKQNTMPPLLAISTPILFFLCFGVWLSYKKQ